MTEKIKCVIVEDEDHSRMLIEDYISKVATLELIGSFTSPIDLLNFTNLDDVQIIYLDIQMPDMTGIEFLKTIPVNAEVIFTTAYSDYALEGYSLNVTDYLLKPVELSRFMQATHKASDNIQIKKKKKIFGKEDCIVLKVDKKLVKVSVNDIIYIQSNWDYVHIMMRKKKYIVHSTMKNVEDLLSKYQFIRIHKSYLINANLIDFMEGNVIVVQGKRLPVSRRCKDNLMKKLFFL